jgi:Papain fold toxin 2
MDDREIWQTVSEIVTRYQLLKCVGVASLQENRCAIAVMQWLRENGIEGKILRLRTYIQQVKFTFKYYYQALRILQSLGKEYCQ